MNDPRYRKGRKSIAEAIAESSDTEFVAVTYERYEHIEGPFFHGTKMRFEVGDELVAGRYSNYHEGSVSKHVYFAALIEPAVWAAELAVALSASLGGGEERSRVYVVEPTGPFEDDPNVTNKKFPGNVTQSYRTRHPMRVVEELQTWEPHSQEALHAMLNNIVRLRQQGLDVIED
jgi:Rifampin ADP-ribosyl transferase